MDWRYRLLWIDSLGGLGVGLIVLLVHRWLAKLHQLPQGFLMLIDLVNIAYGLYSLSLVLRKNRPRSLIFLLIIANLVWAIICIRWAFIFRGSASVFGLIHLVGEGIYVGGLAYLEWRWRKLLLSASQSKQRDKISLS